MSDQRSFTWSSGRLPSSPLVDFWQISLTAQDPAVPNLPLETPVESGTITFSSFADSDSFSAYAINATISPALLTNAQSFGAFATRGQIGFASYTNTSTLNAFAINGQIGFAAFSDSDSFGTYAINATISLASFANAQSFGAFGVNGQIGFAAFSDSDSFSAYSINATLAPAALTNISTFSTYAVNGRIGFAAVIDQDVFPPFEVESGPSGGEHPITFEPLINQQSFGRFDITFHRDTATGSAKKAAAKRDEAEDEEPKPEIAPHPITFAPLINQQTFHQFFIETDRPRLPGILASLTVARARRRAAKIKKIEELEQRQIAANKRRQIIDDDDSDWMQLL